MWRTAREKPQRKSQKLKNKSMQEILTWQTGQVDDATSGGPHQGQETLGDPDGAEPVDVHHGLVLRHRAPLRIGKRRHPGIVHHRPQICPRERQRSRLWAQRMLGLTWRTWAWFLKNQFSERCNARYELHLQQALPKRRELAGVVSPVNHYIMACQKRREGSRLLACRKPG